MLAAERPVACDGVSEAWIVERLDIEGEELPIIRQADSWIPAPLALWYALRTRFALSPSSLFSELRRVCILYNWAEATDDIGNIETFLTEGHVLDKNELMQLVTQLRRQHPVKSPVSTATKQRTGIVSSRIFNLRLFAVRQFLEWAMEPSNHGGRDTVDDDLLEAQVSKMIRVLERNRLPVSESRRREPLTPIEIQLIRRAIAPDEFGEFRPGIFTVSTRYRNWVMFELALNLGVRKGELLTLRLHHLPSGSDDIQFFIPRQQDEAEDPRKRRRLRGKTNERRVPLMDRTRLSSILSYRDTLRPVVLGDSRIKSPYLVAKKGRKSFQTKWISRTAEPLVHECIKRIKDLTAEARRRAVILEADPTRVPLSPDLQKAWVLAVADVAEILGYKTGSGITRIPEAELPRQRFPVAHKRMWFYYPRDIELYLMRRRVKSLYTVRYEDNTIQKLSESLFITFAQIKSGVPCRLLAEPITYKQLHQFLSRSTSGSSDGMFTLYGKTPEEKAMAINLNSFRHWLHHVAYKGGLHEHLLARYFARDNPQSSRPYLHFTPPQIAEYVRDEIRAGRVFGNIAKTYWSLPEDQREDYLLGQVNAGHITPWGLCARNFALKPCDKHLNYLNNCSSFLCTKGDQREVSALIDLQGKTAALLKTAEDAETKGEQWAEAMVGYNAATLANIDVILATHMSLDGKEGEMIRPFKKGRSLAES